LGKEQLIIRNAAISIGNVAIKMNGPAINNRECSNKYLGKGQFIIDNAAIKQNMGMQQ